MKKAGIEEQADVPVTGFSEDLCQLQNEERERNREKRTNRRKTRSLDRRHLYCTELIKGSPSEGKCSLSKSQDFHPLLTDEDRSWIINHIQNRRRRHLSLQDYLRKNRQIFTLQYSLNIKENEIEYLEHHLHNQEHVLLQSERHLMEDIALFDQFLEACNRQANEAAHRAEDESRKKEELINEIKRLEKLLINSRNDHNHLIDTSRQYQRYQQFLFQFAPQEWREQQMVENLENNIVAQNCALYFTKPEELLEIFNEMEEKSLPLVQKSQMTSESLEQIQYTINQTLLDQDHQVEQLQEKITRLEEQIKHEIDREISCQNLLIEYKTSKDKPLIGQIKTTIENLYKKYLLSDDIGLSSVHMLQAIEDHMKALFMQIKHLDSALIIEAEKTREMIVRTMEYQEKIRQDKILNELKHQKAFIRASTPPYPKLGRKLMERSRPVNNRKFRVQHSKNNKQEQWIELLED